MRMQKFFTNEARLAHLESLHRQGLSQQADKLAWEWIKAGVFQFPDFLLWLRKRDKAFGLRETRHVSESEERHS